MAGLIALLGVALILCVVAFPTPNDISVGEMAYQKLWLGRMTVVFAVCCLPFLCLNKKQYLSFPSIVTWVLIILGGIEAIWGLRQIYGFAVSNHSLYALTGSFYNPGPYSGYLAMIFPLCLHEWLNLKEKTERTWIEQGKYYMALGVMLLILCVPTNFSSFGICPMLAHSSMRQRTWTGSLPPYTSSAFSQSRLNSWV